MGFIDFLKGKNNYEDEDVYEDEEVSEEKPSETKTAEPRPASAISSSSLEMKICKPEKYEDALAIAKHLVERRTVVLNLELANKDSVIRIIDFLSGVVYALKGNLRRVASATYVITPANVDVTSELPQTPTSVESVESKKPRELF